MECRARGGGRAVKASARCVVCEGTESREAFRARDWYVGANGDEFAYRRCLGCGTVFQHPQPTDEQLGHAYASCYFGRLGLSTPARLLRSLSTQQREAGRLVSLCDPGGPAVDVGTGDGSFLECLRRAGWRGPLSAVEPDPESAERVRERLGVDVLTAAAETMKLEPGSAELVVLRHVVEHLRDPRAALTGIAKALRPGGTLYLAAPDRRALSERAFGRYWAGYDPPRHLFAFDRDALRRLASDSGLSVVAEWSDFSPQGWVQSVQFTLRRGRDRGWVSRATTLWNPLVSGLAAAGGLLEVGLRRSTRYALLARKDFA